MKPLSLPLLTGYLLAMLGTGPHGHCQPAPRFIVDTPEGSHVDVAIQSLRPGGPLEWIQNGERQASPQFLAFMQTGRKLPALWPDSFVLLTNGDRIPLDPDAAVGLKDNRLRVWPTAALPGYQKDALSLFAPNVVMCFWSIPQGDDSAEKFFARVAREPRSRDVVYLRNGDRAVGTLGGIDGKGCVLNQEDRPLPIPWRLIAGIAWNTDRQARLRTKQTYYRAILAGGARVNFLDLQFDPKARRWLGKTQFGAAVELPEPSLLALDCHQGPALDLSDLKPANFGARPYLGVSWPLAHDLTADGHALRLVGNAFEKGLGTHAPCRVSYRLNKKFKRFDALVGIDAITSPRGRARIALELDGKRIEVSAGTELTAKAPPVEIRQNVAGIETLTLIVETGSFGDVQANVNWVKARLVKK
ncbi:MAG: NPCBM/NEW2 domain-containing protein [Planctomycetes bacterium]|nr:NPCBM/NEW2 domain-containing protein [Planctomycetota bacterium]